jgi:hypothetical protein
MAFGSIRVMSLDVTTPTLALPGIENVKQLAGLFDKTG